MARGQATRQDSTQSTSSQISLLPFLNNDLNLTPLDLGLHEIASEVSSSRDTYEHQENNYQEEADTYQTNGIVNEEN